MHRTGTRWRVLHRLALGLAVLTSVCGLLIGDAAAYAPRIEQGLAWLQSQIGGDGSLTSEAGSIATTGQARTETLDALLRLNARDERVVSNVQSGADASTEQIARRILTLSAAGKSVLSQITLLKAAQNTDGGFGASQGYRSNALDTAWALLALSVQAPSDVTSRAFTHLVEVQNSDGGYAAPTGVSRVYVTSYVLLALERYRSTYNVGQSSANALAWLQAQQVNGAYADSLHNALASLALGQASSDSSRYVRALSALQSAQQADGSWQQDPYVTSLALRALQVLGTIEGPPPPPPATTGAVIGTLVDAATLEPITGVQVTLGTLSTTTDPTGHFEFLEVPPGTYALTIHAPGYAPGGGSVTVAAGSTFDFGNLPVTPAATTAILHGTITNAAGQGLGGATLTITRDGETIAQAVTAGNGTFNLPQLSPGPVVITVSLPGYQTITVSSNLEPGGSFTFSPTLVPADDTDPPPTSATLTGQVVDAHEGQPVAGATVQVGARQTVTGADGRFSLEALNEGAFSGSVSASGYQALTFSGTLVLGSNQAGTLRLVPVAQAVTLEGVVRDASSGQPIAGAQVLVQGAGLSATTGVDGRYLLSGIPDTSFTLYIEASGYFGDTRQIQVASFGRYTVNVSLGRNGSTGVTLDVATALATYDPFREVKIAGVVHNGTDEVKDLAFTASILDPQRRVLAEFPAVPFLERTTAPTTFPVPANGSLDLKTEWYNLESPAGQYTVVIRGRDASGVLVAEGSTTFTITSARAIGGTIQLDPPIVQAGTNTPVAVTAQLANMGNLPLPAGPLNVEFILESPDPSLPQVIPSTARADWNGAPLNKPEGSVLDAAGNLYVINAGDRKILKRTPGGVVSLVATLSMTPDEIDIDSNGNLYVLGLLRNKLVRVSPTTGVETTINTGIATNMDSMALDSQDNLYVYGQTGGVLMKIAPNGTQTPLIRAGLSSPEDGVEGPDGYLYVTNGGNDTLSKVDAQGRVSSWVTSGLNDPHGIALGPDGNFYVANYGANTISRVTPAGQVSVFASGLSGPYFLAFDPSGNLLVTNSLNDTVSKVTPAGVTSTFAQNATHNPQGATYDASGSLFIVNEGNNSVTKVGTDGLVTTVATGTGTNSRDIEAAANGDLYVTNLNIIHRISGTTRTTFASGLSSVGGLAIDPSGSIYITEANPVRVTRIGAGGVKETVAKSFLNTPGAAAVDTAGNAYIANSSSLALLPPSGMGDLLLSSTSSIGTINGVARAPMGGALLLANGNKVVHVAQDGTTTTLSTLTSTMAGIATDPAGTVYVRDNTSKIYKLNASWQAVLFVTMASGPRGMSFAADGTMYVSLTNGAVSKVTTAGVVQAFTTGLTNPTNLHAHADGNVYVITNSGTRLTKVTSAGVSSSLVTGLTVANTVVPAGTDLLVTESTLVRRVSTSGQTLERIAQMSSLKDIEWVNGKLVIVDSGLSRILSLVPGGNPGVYASTSADFIAANGANVLASSGNLIKDVQPDGTVTTFHTGSSILNGVAVSSAGAIAVVSRVASELTLLNQARQVTANYAGIFSPTGIAVAPDGKVYVGQSSGQVVQIDADGGQSRIFSNLPAVRALHRRPDGTFLAAHTTGAAIIQPNGTWQNIPAGAAGSVNALVQFNGGVYGLMLADAIDQLVSGTFEPFALGMAGACEIAIEATDVLAALCQFRGITRFIDGRLVRVTEDLGRAVTLEPIPTGGYLVANDVNWVQEGITHISTTGTVTHWGGDMLLRGTAPGDLTALADGSVLLASPGTDAIIRITPGLPAPLPTAGTVMATRTVDVPPVPVSGAATSLDFGQWTPTVAGDYRVRIRSESVQGELATFLHVGPHARAEMAASRTSAGPGDVPVTVQVKVEGADFTSISRADTSSLTAIAAVPAPKAIGADAAGNIWYIEGTALKRRTPTGTTSTVYTGTLTTFGIIPVDSQQNVYVGVAPNQIVKVTPGGVASTHASLPSTYSVAALAIDSVDRLYVSGRIISGSQGGSARLFMVSASGVVEQMATPDFSYIYAITTDGADNLYALHQQSWGIVHKVAKDGTTHVALSELYYEDVSEGIPMAGDCADNLIFTMRGWPGIGQEVLEEYLLVHYISRTKGAGAVINGLTTTPRLYDLDAVVFDRFNSRLVIFADGQWDEPEVPNTIYTLPITCGAINTQLNLVMPAGQSATGFNPAPTSTIALPDGATHYVWDLRDVVTSGMTISYDTVLSGLQIGESLTTAREAFLTFSNTFAANEVRVPIRVPSVEGKGLIDLALSTDRATYPANAEVLSTLTLDSLSEGPVSGTVTVRLLDASGSSVATLIDQPSVLPALDSTTLTPPLNTGTLRPGNYTLAASFIDETGLLQDSASVAFAISSTAVANEVTSTVSTDYRQYNPDALVDVLARLQSTAVNYSQQQVLSTLTVTGPSGQSVFTGYQSTRELSPGLMVDQHFNVQLIHAPLGTYTATLVVTDPFDRTVSTSSTTFEVIESLTGAIAGSVTAAPRRVEIGSPVSCVDTVANQRSYAFGAVPLRQTLIRLSDGAVLDSTAFDAALGAQSSTQYTRAVQAVGFPAGDYACALELLDGGTWRSLGHAAFVVSPAPARIEGTTAAELAELVRGGVQTCADTLANTGGSTAQNLLVRQTVLGAADQVVREQQQSINLAPSTQQVLTRQFGTTEFTAGLYACAVEVREGTTWRQLSRASFEVKPVPAQVTGQTQVSQAQLERGGVQVCTDMLTNSGDVAAENALIRRMLSGETTIDSLEQSLTIAGGATQALSRDIDTTNLSAGDYTCAVEIREGESWKVLDSATFTVKPIPAKVLGSVAVANAEVDYGTSQTCTDTLDNSGDVTATGIVIRRNLVDATGTSLRSAEQTLDIASHTPQTLTRTLDLAGLSAGNYSCVLEQQAGTSWTELGRVGFAIKPAPAKVEGSVSVAQEQVQRGTAQTCTDVLTNSGGLPATGAVIRQRLAREVGDETLQTQQQTLDLEAGASQSLTRTYGTADLSAGGYVCALDLQEGESWKPLAQARFTVTAVPARIEGQTTVQLAQLERGATQTCTDVLRNTGDLTATDALVRQTLTSATGGLIRSQEQTLTIAGGATQALTRELATTDLTAGDYACAVEVKEGDEWRSLSRAVFTVLPLPATIVGSVTVGAPEVEFGSSQLCTDQLTNTGDLSAAAVVLRRTLVSDASGEALVTANETIGLDAGASRTLPRTLDLNGVAAGAYACVLEMQEGEGWRFLGRAAFTIKPAPARVEGTTSATLAELVRGTAQSCSDHLTNTGGLPAENAVIRQALAREDGEVLQSQLQTLTLAAGAAQDLARTYATSDLTAGAYACTLEVQEGDSFRLLSRASFELKPVPAQVTGQTQVSQAQLERGGVQVCTDTLSNSGDVTAENALIRRTLLSGDTTIDSLEQSLTIAGGATQALSRDIDTTNLTAGDYTCTVEIREGESWKPLGRATFTVKPIPAKVVGSVAVASSEVDYGTSQTCTDTLDNSGDVTASGVVIRRSLVDATGTSLRSVEQTLDIASHTPQTLTRTLDLAGLSAGNYSCVLEQQAGNSWTELGRAGFAIKPAPAKVEGSVSVVQVEVQRGTAQTCTDVLTNSGGLPATGAVIRQGLAREVGDETLQTQQQTLDLEAGASQSLTRTYGTADLSAGGYVCALDLQEGETWKPLAQARFTVTAVPARIEGQTTVQLAQLERGATQTCTDTVRNVGDVTATGVIVRQSILQSATGSLLQTREQTLDVPHEPEQQLIRVFTTQDLVPGEYACQLDVREGQAWKRLGQAPFVVQEPALRVQANLGVGSRGRVLVLTDEPLTDQDIDERMFLDSLLESTGWSFTVDTNALAFTEDLRSGEYSTYALLSGKEKLAEMSQKELREAIFRGEGLVEAGSHDQRNNNVDEALGIQFNGKHSSATAVQLAASTLHGGGSSALHRTQHNLRATLGTGQSAGSYVGTGTPTTAVTTNAFGLGKSVYTGFDLLLEGTYQGPTGFFADLFGKSLDFVTPSLAPLATGSVVPLRLHLVNQGTATQLRVLLPLPAGVEVVDRGAAQIDTSGRLVWSLILAANEERTLEAWVRLPASPTTVHFDGDIQALRNGAWVSLAHATFDAQVLDRPDLDEARTLAAANPAYQQVLHWIDKAQQSIALSDYARALSELTRASDEAAKVNDPAIRDLRVAIGEAIRDVGKRL